MEEFVRPQIQEGCRLAFPEGLQDLMSDISREVLRAQPLDLCKFIADYLAALMVARENMSIAAHLCDAPCSGACNRELDDEFRYLGFDEVDAEKMMKVVLEHFEKGEVNEQNLMIKITKKTSVDSSMLPAVQEAVRTAFKRHLINHTTVYQSSSDSDIDEVTRAAKHTLHLYRKTRHTPEEYVRAAETIQIAYQAYGVRRHRASGQETPPRCEKAPARNIRFSDPKPECMPTTHFRSNMASASSTSLAGSYLHLPKYVPYTVHGPKVLEADERNETESSSVLYNEDVPSTSHRRISFQVSPRETVEDKAILADDESESSVQEEIQNSETEEEETSQFHSEQNEDKIEEVDVQSEEKEDTEEEGKIHSENDTNKDDIEVREKVHLELERDVKGEYISGENEYQNEKEDINFEENVDQETEGNIDSEDNENIKEYKHFHSEDSDNSEGKEDVNSYGDEESDDGEEENLVFEE